MYYHVSFYKEQTGNHMDDCLLVPCKAKSDIELVDKESKIAKNAGYNFITVYRGYMYKGERRWKTIVCRRPV